MDGMTHRVTRRHENESKAAGSPLTDPQGLVEFGCECSKFDCERSVRVPLYVYRRILESGRPVPAPGRSPRIPALPHDRLVRSDEYRGANLALEVFALVVRDVFALRREIACRAFLALGGGKPLLLLLSLATLPDGSFSRRLGLGLLPTVSQIQPSLLSNRASFAASPKAPAPTRADRGHLAPLPA